MNIDGEQLENVEQFAYLGSIVNRGNEINPEINNRLNKSTTFYHQVRELLWDDKVPRRTKLTLYKQYFIPIVTYGLETLVTNKRQDSKIQAAEMKFLRTSVKKTRRDRIQNIKIREDLNVEPLVQRIQKARLRWFGHVKRMGKERVARRELEREVKGKRSVGRPRRRWMDQIWKDIREAGLDVAEVMEQEKWKDRKEWRRLVNHTRATGVGH